MTDQHLTDLLPDLVRGRAPWTAEARAHLAECEECAAELDLLELSASSLASDAPVVDVAAVTTTVLARLRAADDGVIDLAEHPRTKRRWGVTRWAVGLAAAAAVVVAVTSQRPGAEPSAPEPTVATQSGSILPELRGLDAAELEILLATVTPAERTEEAVSDLPRLGDLNDTELEQLLETMEG